MTTFIHRADGSGCIVVIPGTPIDAAIAPLDDVLSDQAIADCDRIGASLLLEYASALAEGRIGLGARENLVETFGPDALSVSRALVSLAMRLSSRLRERDDV